MKVTKPHETQAQCVITVAVAHSRLSRRRCTAAVCLMHANLTNEEIVITGKGFRIFEQCCNRFTTQDRRISFWAAVQADTVCLRCSWLLTIVTKYYLVLSGDLKISECCCVNSIPVQLDCALLISNRYSVCELVARFLTRAAKLADDVSLQIDDEFTDVVVPLLCVCVQLCWIVFLCCWTTYVINKKLL